MCYVIAQTVHYALIALTKKPRNRGRAFDEYLSQVSYRRKKLSDFRMTKKKWRSLIFLFIVTETIERSVANMALLFIDYDYDTIARPFIYGIARVHL